MARTIFKATPAFHLPDGSLVPARRAQAVDEPSAAELKAFDEPYPDPLPMLPWWRRALGEDVIRQKAHRARIEAWSARREAHESRRASALDRAATAAATIAAHQAHEELFRTSRLHAETERAATEKRVHEETERQLREQGRERALALRLPAVWRSMDGLVFEANVAWIFRACGWRAELTQVSGDGGADVILTKDTRKIVVQCKAHRASVGSPVVRDLLGTAIDFKADEAFLCVLEDVTAAAKELADRHGIKIFTATGLARLAEEICEQEIRGHRLQPSDSVS